MDFKILKVKKYWLDGDYSNVWFRFLGKKYKKRFLLGINSRTYEYDLYRKVSDYIKKNILPKKEEKKENKSVSSFVGKVFTLDNFEGQMWK